MMKMIELENIMGQEVSASLESPLDHLESGAQVFFLHENASANATHIQISHPQAPHRPDYSVAWISEDGQFMLIAPRRVDPDSDEGPSTRTLVKLVAPNAFEILTPDRVLVAATSVRREIESKIGEGGAALEKHLQILASKYL